MRRFRWFTAFYYNKAPKGDSVGCIALWMLFCVRSVNLNFLCRFSVWWNLRILLSHSCWMFCTAYKNKVYLIHSAHVRAKRAEICFLASTRGRHLGNRPRDKNANSARTEARCLGDAKAARTRFDPKVSGSNPGTRVLEKGHVFIVTSLPAGNGLRETLKKHCNLRIRWRKRNSTEFLPWVPQASHGKRNSSEFLPWVPQVSHGIMATIVRAIWLAAERAGFPCNDRGHYKNFPSPGDSRKCSNKTHSKTFPLNNSCI